MNGKNQNLNLSRRHLIKMSSGFIGTGVLATIVGSNLATPKEAVAAPPATSGNNMTPDEALQLLIDGNNRFVTNKRTNPNQGSQRLVEVAESQNPFAAILGCADSRVPAEILFDRGFGDLFVCRVAGNLATTEEVGSLEFGAMVLGTKVIMVLGHERCGAVQATIQGGQYPGQISSLVDGLQVAIDRVNSKGDLSKLEAACKANVLYQVEKLNNSMVLADLVKQGKLKIVGGYFDLDEGTVTLVT